MQIHAPELAQVRAAARAGIGRFDLYARIHKALRAFMADTLVLIGRTDPHDAEAVARTVAQVEQLLSFCADHVAQENDFVHPALDARCPDTSTGATRDHAGHLLHIAQLREMSQGLSASEGVDREVALHVLYLAMALFVADNLQHMHVEETVHNSALWNACTDLELLAVHEALVASVAPANHMIAMRWMLPNLNACERQVMLGGMRQGAPAKAFQAVLEATRTHLNERDRDRLASDLHVAATPGFASV